MMASTYRFWSSDRCTYPRDRDRDRPRRFVTLLLAFFLLALASVANVEWDADPFGCCLAASPTRNRPRSLPGWAAASTTGGETHQIPTRTTTSRHPPRLRRPRPPPEGKCSRPASLPQSRKACRRTLARRRRDGPCGEGSGGDGSAVAPSWSPSSFRFHDMFLGLLVQRDALGVAGRRLYCEMKFGERLHSRKRRRVSRSTKFGISAHLCHHLCHDASVLVSSTFRMAQIRPRRIFSTQLPDDTLVLLWRVPGPHRSLCPLCKCEHELDPSPIVPPYE
jgi:hypothetical protein